MTTLLPWGDLLVRGAAQHPDRDAFVFPEVRRSYAEMVERAVDVGRALVSLGVGKGDHVGILMPNCIDFLEVLFGCAFVGAVCVPINARFKTRELAYVVENADLVAIFTSDIVEQHTDYVALLHEALPGLADSAGPDGAGESRAAAPLRCAASCSSGRAPAPGFLDRPGFGRDVAAPPSLIDDMHRRVAVRDVAVIFYTSGTTAMPKGCLLDHETLVRVGSRHAAGGWARRRRPDVGPAAAVPHGGHPAAGRRARRRAAPYVTMTHFEPAAALELIGRAGDVDVHGVPDHRPGAARPRGAARRRSTASRHHVQRRPARPLQGDAGAHAQHGAGERRSG